MADLDIEIVTEIAGLDELEEAFTDGAKRAVKKFLRHAEMEASKPIVEAAKANAPYLTGDLEHGIHRESVLDSSSGTLTLRIGPGPEVYYGLMDELGSVHQEGTHWMEQAAISVKDEVLEKFYEALDEGLKDMKK
jgi:HK97 gp10 family phage protein